MLEHLQRAVGEGELREIDFYLARELAAVAGRDDPALLLAAALVSRQTGQGHVCIELDKLAGRPVLEGESAPSAPELGAWREALTRSRVVGAPGEDAPLILDARDRLYLGRYWHFEAGIAARLRDLAATPLSVGEPGVMAGRLAHYFPKRDEGPDRQKLAAATALLNRLTVISGGPGTGKTTTVTKLLALLIEAAGEAKPPRIELAAPTGKAAARLAESIRNAGEGLACEPRVREAIVPEAATIHRLLGAIPGRIGFRHNADNPLHLDVLVVDEASMIDVPLMARLLDALPPHARLVLLGDKDQLASVEAGSVLGDICQGGEAGPSPAFRKRLAELGVEAPEGMPAAESTLADSLVVLTRSYRFGDDSGIGNLARAINRGDAEAAMQVCEAAAFPDAQWADATAAELGERVAARARAAYAAYRKESDPAAALEAFGRFRFLCALREGPHGVVAVNRLVEGALGGAGLIRPGEHRHDVHYAGRPIMVTRNDYGVRLFNGDIGLILPDPEAEGHLRAFFPVADGGVRRVLVSRLPPHETVFAMTIHKSQGSEFDECVVILPESDAPMLTRELVYTGVTRAKQAVELWGGRDALTRALGRRVERASGLKEALHAPL